VRRGKGRREVRGVIARVGILWEKAMMFPVLMMVEVPVKRVPHTYTESSESIELIKVRWKKNQMEMLLV